MLFSISKEKTKACSILLATKSVYIKSKEENKLESVWFLRKMSVKSNKRLFGGYRTHRCFVKYSTNEK